ncbi:hypothetical protein J6590_035037 [Homalodisca vitripennis]|nr:hypothetical protein J6590_035037 [Homalodisca vitripennis]
MKDLGGNVDTNGNSFIRLSLRKPREWKVALTTSVSSPAIIPPKIQLWDEVRGKMILETTQDRVACARSKSASFVRRGAETPVGRRESDGQKERQKYSLKQQKVELPSKAVNSDKMGLQYRVHTQEDTRNCRSKSLSVRGREERLVHPVDCVRPRTPVMVARRVSLSSSGKSLTLERPQTQQNGITTHHRKHFTEDDNRRKVKRNVSFGKVDTFDDSSSFSSSLSASKLGRCRISRQSGSYSSSPRIIITEPADSEEDLTQVTVAENDNRPKRTKRRSRSGIPVLIKKHSDSPVSSFQEIIPSNNKFINNSNSLENGCRKHRINHSNVSSERSGRRSRMEMFMCDGAAKHRFSIIRTPEPPEPPPLPPPSAYPENRTHHHFPCERGNCPFAKYFDEQPAVTQPVRNGNTSRRSRDRKSFTSSMISTPVTEIHSKMKYKEKGVVQQNEQCKREGSRSRRRRVSSKCREQMMSLSSSDSEDIKSPRIPPRRRRRSQNPKDEIFLDSNKLMGLLRNIR